MGQAYVKAKLILEGPPSVAKAPCFRARWGIVHVGRKATRRLGTAHTPADVAACSGLHLPRGRRHISPLRPCPRNGR